MNIAEYSIKKSVITITLTIVCIYLGIQSFRGLPRLEDPEFTIKEAIILTPYPGATAAEVEEEVTNVIEKAVQEMGQLKRVESTSSRGLSTVKAVIKDEYDKNSLPQVWDELRRKVNDYQSQLPPGAGPSIVNDDYGDVYGVYLAITGEGYTYAELKDYADLLKRELLLVDDVKKIVLYGEQPEAVYVEMSRSKMAALEISQFDIYNALRAKNLPADAGTIDVGKEYFPINPTGEFTSVDQFGDLLISSRGGDSLVYLRDVADVRRGYKDPPRNMLRYNGKPAIGLAISTVLGGNVVTMGEQIDEKIKELEPLVPLGMELEVISLQSESVTQAINGFVVNLVEAIIIVVVVLLFAMGLRSGLIIGAVLFITICGTFVFMGMWSITLERISLGALIIALGMLVDNAIVVVDGMKIKMEQGEDAVKAAREIVGQTAMPLLGATVVAVLAFAAIGTSKDSTGEYCRSLFQVILISLMFSWVTAVTITPLMCKYFLKGKDTKGDEPARDPYAGGFFQAYKKLLVAAIRFRYITIGAVVGIFILSLIGFGFVKTMFFPTATRPQFFVEVYFPEGYRIQDTAKELEKAEEYLRGIEGVTDVTSEIGGGDPRFLLTYVPGKASPSFAVILASVEEYGVIDNIYNKAQTDLENLLPNAVVNVRKFLLGPGEGGKIQLRIYGPDRTVLRELAGAAKEILKSDPQAKAVRDEWKEKLKVVRPRLEEAQASQLGISRPDVAKVFQESFSGTTTGVYRDKAAFEGQLLPIIARAPEDERLDLDTIQSLQVWSPAAGRMIPIGQVVSGFDTETEDANIGRRDRMTMIKIHADPRTELPSELMARVKPEIEKALNVDVGKVTGKDFGPEDDPFKDFTHDVIPVRDADMLPLRGMPGYYIAWGGEAEDSARANAGLATKLPIFFGMMVLVVVFLFNSVRQPLIIWLTVPLSIIGVTAGLLIFKQPFGFMALLGLLSLSGMLIKNAIVLIDQIDSEIKSGKDKYLSVVDSGVSRLNPVMMAAATTILGMIPLLQDAFFVSMAVTIMFGLLIATVLTLVVVPVLYTMFFKIPSPSK
ncbi:MAG TPA: efflux RND transporter permease subunit [Thermodesulfobacteriota bacterium]|nr:efflux RND transporter permease subunit [Thermodesulfobacteriota bacterium]